MFAGSSYEPGGRPRVVICRANKSRSTSEARRGGSSGKGDQLPGCFKFAGS